MDWTEIKIKVPTEATEQAAAIANMTVSHGIYIEDYSDLEQGAMEIAHIDLIDEDLVKSDRKHSIIHIYLSKEVNPRESVEYITERLSALNIEYELGEIDISEEEWENNWKQFFKCTEIGKRLCVCPSWEEYNNKDGRVILSIDPVAVKVAKENAALNGVENKVKYILGNLDEEITETYDIVVANIVADAIIALSDSAKKRMKKNGYFLCSGIIDIRADEVENALTDRGYSIVRKITNNNWVAFLCNINEE